MDHLFAGPDLEAYDRASTQRWVPEPPKRVDAPERTAFERDRARVVHTAASRRLAAKTQVVGPTSDDFVRNRLTHSLEVAQVARDLARALGCDPDLAETAALAHDLGHPPFGHNGERALAALAGECGGFEGNAQTFRLLTRLEAKSFDEQGHSAGLNLTRATLDACSKYPWPAAEAPESGGVHADGTPALSAKFGVYEEDLTIFTWVREGAPVGQACVEAQVMDLADDVAYSVHDVEDGIVAGRLDLTELAGDTSGVWDTVRAWYLPDASDDDLDEVLLGLQSVGTWPTAAYDGTRRSLAQLKNLTSDLIGRFCGSVQSATTVEGPARHRGSLVIPDLTRLEIGLLKGVAAHFVMQADDRLVAQERQRELLTELVAVLRERGADGLDRMHAEDWRAAPTESAQMRVVVDQVSALTDVSAVQWHERLCGRAQRSAAGS